VISREFRPEDVALIKDRIGMRGDWDGEVKVKEGLKPSATFLSNSGEVMACGGVFILWPGTGEAWLFLSRLAGYSVVLSVKKQLEEWMKQYDLQRVQAEVRSDFSAGRRFLEWLGMDLEGTLRKFGPNGFDYAMYARVT